MPNPLRLPPLRCLLAAGLAGPALAVGLRAAADWQLPPLQGDLAGDFIPLKLAGAPKLHWTLSLRSARPDERAVELAVDGPATHLRAAAQVDPAGNGKWRVVESELGVAQWFALLAPLAGDVLQGTTAEGGLAVTGEGSVRHATVEGQVRIDLHAAALRNATDKWSVEGIALRGGFRPGAGFASDGPVQLTFQQASGAAVVANEGVIEFAIGADETVHVSRATCAVFGGHVELTPFTLKPGLPELQGELAFNQVEIAQMLRFLPALLTDATGRVSGRMHLDWAAKTGLTSAIGTLQSDSGASASIKLAPSPGLLTSRLPAKMRERIELLPGWVGPLRKLFNPVNPAYATLRAIEMGEMRLEVNALDIGIQPAGDATGRTARVVLTARPQKSDVVEKVRLEINLTGPLADLLRMGMEGGVKVQLR